MLIPPSAGALRPSCPPVWGTAWWSGSTGWGGATRRWARVGGAAAPPGSGPPGLDPELQHGWLQPAPAWRRRRGSGKRSGSAVVKGYHGPGHHPSSIALEETLRRHFERGRAGSGGAKCRCRPSRERVSRQQCRRLRVAPLRPPCSATSSPPSVPVWPVVVPRLCLSRSALLIAGPRGGRAGSMGGLWDMALQGIARRIGCAVY